MIYLTADQNKNHSFFKPSDTALNSPYYIFYTCKVV